MGLRVQHLGLKPDLTLCLCGLAYKFCSKHVCYWRPVASLLTAAAAFCLHVLSDPLPSLLLSHQTHTPSTKHPPQLYKECRDAMLSLYWEQPERELAFETVRQHIDGEVNDLRK